MKFKTNEERQASIERILENNKREIQAIDELIEEICQKIEGLTCEFLKVYFNTDSEIYELVAVFEYYGVHFGFKDDKQDIRGFNHRYFDETLASYVYSLNLNKKEFKLQEKVEACDAEEPQSLAPHRVWQPNEWTAPIRETHQHVQINEARDYFYATNPTQIPGMRIELEPAQLLVDAEAAGEPEAHHPTQAAVLADFEQIRPALEEGQIWGTSVHEQTMARQAGIAREAMARLNETLPR